MVCTQISTTINKRLYSFVMKFSVTVIRNGVEEDIKCQEIVQGDIVMAVKDCDVPCDLVLIKSSDPNSKVHITTANLDGETNLKTLMVPKGLPNVSIGNFNFSVSYSSP